MSNHHLLEDGLYYSYLTCVRIVSTAPKSFSIWSFNAPATHQHVNITIRKHTYIHTYIHTYMKRTWDVTFRFFFLLSPQDPQPSRRSDQIRSDQIRSDQIYTHARNEREIYELRTHTSVGLGRGAHDGPKEGVVPMPATIVTHRGRNLRSQNYG